MSSPETRPPTVIPPAAPAARAAETFRAKSIATRITEAEFAEIEAAAARTGKKVSEWLRDAALAQARTSPVDQTDPVLLAELMAIRTLVLNLFASASKGTLTEESVRKMSAYADSIKQQKAQEFLARQRSAKNGKVSEVKP
jgi:hypothetical protein